MQWILVLLWMLHNATQSIGQKEPKRAPPMITNFLPYDLLRPEQVKFRVQKAFVLPCGASGENLKWSWYHNDTKIPEGELLYGNRKLGRDGTLTGSSLDSSHSGTYQCFVKDTVSNIQTFSREIKVAVTVTGQFADQTPVEKLVNLGSPFNYTCPANKPSYGASYSWEGKNMIQFERNERRGILPSTGDLFIMFVTQEDIDEITTLDGIRCTVSAANTFYSSGALKLKKRTPDQADPQTLSSPTWKVLPGSTEKALERRNKTLYCFAVGRPAPRITWKKNTIPIQSGRDSFEIPSAFKGRRLSIINVQKDIHEGQYICEAENSENAGNPIKHNINLEVEVYPRWATGRPPENKITIGKTANTTLTCDVTAIPTPSFSWFRDGQRITASTNRVRLDNNKLHFQEITFDEDGLYQCVAENVHGMIVSSTWLHVVVSADGQGGNITLDTEANITVVCKPDYIEVVLEKIYFPGIIVNDSVLHLEDKACAAGYKDDDMVKFTFGLESCGTMMKDEGDKIYYMNSVYLMAEPETDDDDITRKHTEVIPFQCGYEKLATLSKVSYSPRSTLVITDAEGFGNFTYEMDMYTDGSNSEEVTKFPHEVGLGQPMYFGFRVISADGGLNVFPDVCKATAGSSFYSTPDHLIIKDACSRDNTLEYDYEEKSEHFFSVDSFRFKEGYDDVFIHCQLTACREDDSGSRCAKGCQETRRRRSLKDDDLRVHLYIGPVKLSNNEGKEALEEKSGTAGESGNSSMVMIVAVLVGVLSTVAIGLIVAVVVISRRRKYAAVSKGSALIVAEEM